MVAVGDRVLAINDSTLDNVKSAQVRLELYIIASVFFGSKQMIIYICTSKILKNRV